jgi:hypothetical protein
MTSKTTKQITPARQANPGANHQHHQKETQMFKATKRTTDEARLVSDLTRAGVTVTLTSAGFELRKGTGLVVTRKLQLNDRDLFALGLIGGVASARRGPERRGEGGLEESKGDFLSTPMLSRPQIQTSI